MKKIKIGDEVYIKIAWADFAVLGTIIGIDTFSQVADIECKYEVTRKGTKLNNHLGVFTRPFKEIYDSHLEIYDLIDEKNRAVREKYENDIKTSLDLALFPLKNFINANEYTDDVAKQVYINKVEEFFNIKILDSLSD